MRIAQDARSEARQGDAVRRQGVQDTEDAGEPLPVSFDVTARHARGSDLCRPGHEPELRHFGEQPRPTAPPAGHARPSAPPHGWAAAPEILDEAPQPRDVQTQGRRHGIDPNPAGPPRQPVGAEQVGQATASLVSEAAQRHCGDRSLRRAHPAGELVPQDVEF
jgi:hypothetical protein